MSHVKRDPLLGLRPEDSDPYAFYDELRAQGTLTPTRSGDWASTSHRVCESVLRDRRFAVRPEDDTESGPADLSFLTMNPPDHTRLRRIVQPSFSPKAVATYRDKMERTVSKLLDRAEAAGQFDLAADFAAPLPISLISDLLGIPDSDSARFAHHGMIIGSTVGNSHSVRQASQLRASIIELSQLFLSLLELRAREPRDDIISLIATAGEDQVKPDEILSMCMLILVAGFETSVGLIGNAMLALLDHPSEWQKLCADPEAMAPKAVEEALRFDPPAHFAVRVALEPLELEGKPVRKGQHVVSLIGGANRDPEVYDQPGTFDISRVTTVSNLAFSSGIHFCLGHAFARLDGTIALQMLAERIPGLSRSGPVEFRDATLIRGPLRFPVTTARSATGAYSCLASARLRVKR